MKLTFGYSPCPNDTFMFHALAGGRIDVAPLSIDVRLHDVQTLNEMAFDATLDVTKLSFFGWLRVMDAYDLLPCGAALGFGCGPLVVSGKPLSREDMPGSRIVLPGEWTTAHLLFRLWAPDARDRVFAPYDRIFADLNEGRADCGVIIHESRFTFEQAGFTAVQDLGAWWEDETGLPIPLGCIAVRRSLPQDVKARLAALVRSSIETARKDPEPAMPYIHEHAREMDPDVLREHIRTFVNDFSLDMGEKGRAAVAELEKRAMEAGLLVGDNGCGLRRTF